ncbi:MAG TPA: UDP-N-acetylenolpyruvoylglucosamine reductase [Clostridiales bacterium]|nr:UDP-N-acetylenolpyruvoylglucosamine reductase [Clostridiales bacterium]
MKYLNEIIDTLSRNKIMYLIDEELSNHTSIKIGGKCKIFVNIKTEKELIYVVNYLQKIKAKFYILGNGTNTLASDNGFDGVVISTQKLNRYKVSFKNNNASIYVQCGMGLFNFGKLLRKMGFSGLEFAYGIPGSVGGAICMNAGAYNQSIGDFVEYVKVLKGGKVKKLSKSEMKFSYRNSIVQKSDIIVLGAKFNFKKGNSKDIENLQQQYFQKRLSSQPYSDLSFGSVFKRKENFEPISKLIDMLGLKGYSIGNAQISKKHAGFIINVGSATCQDCLLLIKYIQKKVYESYGFTPEPEVQFLGD